MDWTNDNTADQQQEQLNNSSSSLQWESDFKSALNRLAKHYLLLLRAASSEVALAEESVDNGEDENGGGTANSHNLNITDPRGERMYNYCIVNKGF